MKLLYGDIWNIGFISSWVPFCQSRIILGSFDHPKYLEPTEFSVDWKKRGHIALIPIENTSNEFLTTPRKVLIFLLSFAFSPQTCLNLLHPSDQVIYFLRISGISEFKKMLVTLSWNLTVKCNVYNLKKSCCIFCE